MGIKDILEYLDCFLVFLVISFAIGMSVAVASIPVLTLCRLFGP